MSQGKQPVLCDRPLAFALDKLTKNQLTDFAAHCPVCKPLQTNARANWNPKRKERFLMSTTIERTTTTPNQSPKSRRWDTASRSAASPTEQPPAGRPFFERNQ